MKLFKVTIYFIDGTFRRVRRAVVMTETTYEAKQRAIKWRNTAYPGATPDTKRSYAFGGDLDGVQVQEVNGNLVSVSSGDQVQYLDEEIAAEKAKAYRG